jgi:hypothetical protein
VLAQGGFIVIFSTRNACHALVTASLVSLNFSALLAHRVSIIANLRNHATPHALLVHSPAHMLHVQCVGLLAVNA